MLAGVVDIWIRNLLQLEMFYKKKSSELRVESFDIYWSSCFPTYLNKNSAVLNYALKISALVYES